MFLYNTLKDKIEKFEPLNKEQVKIYLCGPTVYNYIHVGNARTIIFFDTLKRYLEHLNFNVKLVSNFTDLGEKMNNAAKNEDKLVGEVADFYIKAFYEDTDKLNIKRANMNPKATENITEVIEMIKILLEKEFSYNVNGNIYYNTRKLEDYGKLSNNNFDSEFINEELELVEKKHPEDFLLWKKTEPEEPSWNSPWGEGRPGWHIECSAMIQKYLGKTIDIHAGGKDLCFPHHENEIAQSEVANNSPLSTYWMHTGYVTIENDKMSKSKGNSILLKDLYRRYDPMSIRLFLLLSHYRKPQTFSEEGIKGAEKIITQIKDVKNKLSNRFSFTDEHSDEEQRYIRKIDHIKDEFYKYMDNDCNTPNAITVLQMLLKEINLYLREPISNYNIMKEFEKSLNDILNILGIDVTEEIENEEFENFINQKISEREDAKIKKKYILADEIREELNKIGVVIEDTNDGTRWRKRSNF